MENNCNFVNSRGLLKSCTFYSQYPKSSCNNDNEYLKNMVNSDKMFDGMSIYVCSDLLQYFVNNILQLINKKFVLVSGDSDLCVPIESINENDFNKLIYSSNLIIWYTQNTRYQNHNKIFQLPIGLDYHSISDNPNHTWKLLEEKSMPIEQENILKNIIENSKSFYERISQIYVNFSMVNDRFNQRKQSLINIPNNLLKMNINFIKRTDNWRIMSKYTFVLSPFGNGMDCHRTWEALCLGCIPILKAPNFVNLFEGLPVLFVNDWNEITQDLLLKTIEKFKNTNFDYNKLKLNYWVTKINCYK